MELAPTGNDALPASAELRVSGHSVTRLARGLAQHLMMAGGFAALAVIGRTPPTDPRFSLLWDGLVGLVFGLLAIWMLTMAVRVALALAHGGGPVLLATAEGIAAPIEVEGTVPWPEITAIAAQRSPHGSNDRRAWLTIDLAAPGRRRRHWPFWRTRQLVLWVADPFEVAAQLRAHPGYRGSP